MNVVAFALLAAMLVTYALLDGYDLGVGAVVRLFARSDDERGAAIASIGPFWNGHEVWLIAAGGGLFAFFARADPGCRVGQSPARASARRTREFQRDLCAAAQPVRARGRRLLTHRACATRLVLSAHEPAPSAGAFEPGPGAVVIGSHAGGRRHRVDVCGASAGWPEAHRRGNPGMRRVSSAPRGRLPGAAAQGRSRVRCIVGMYCRVARGRGGNAL